MPRRPATITQADIARVVRAAKQAGATEVELRVGDASILIRIAPSPSTAHESVVELVKEIVL